MIMGEGKEDSHNVDMILGGGLLNDDAWLQRGEGGQKSRKKGLCNKK